MGDGRAQSGFHCHCISILCLKQPRYRPPDAGQSPLVRRLQNPAGRPAETLVFPFQPLQQGGSILSGRLPCQQAGLLPPVLPLRFQSVRLRFPSLLLRLPAGDFLLSLFQSALLLFQPNLRPLDLAGQPLASAVHLGLAAGQSGLFQLQSAAPLLQPPQLFFQLLQPENRLFPSQSRFLPALG